MTSGRNALNVLLIGGTGIISTDVCALASSRGHSVFILNRGTRQYALEQSGAALIKADIRKESVEEIREKLKDREWHIVADFLSFTPKQMQKTLECIKGICHQYIFISSAAVYNKSSDDEIMSEATTAVGNEKWSYGWQKTLAERFLQEHYAEFVKTWTIVRPAVTYNETRIPYGLVPSGNYRMLANRINIGKPAILWDGGKTKCTITSSKDFAVGMVGLFCNEKAYFEAFHITSDERMTWKEVLDDVIKANGKEARVIDIPTKEIIKTLPELKGALLTDKGTNWIFDNAKIKAAVPEFKTTIPFAEGIKRVLEYIASHKELQAVNFFEEGRLDYLCAAHLRRQRLPRDKSLSAKPFIKSGQMRGAMSLLQYYSGRCILLFRLRQLAICLLRAARKVLRRKQ